MARLHTTAAKATRQIERRDRRGAEQYRAELKYFHYKPRVALSIQHDDYYQGARALHYVGQRAWCCDRAFLMLGQEHDVDCLNPRARA
ncbi:hypothetical protein ACWDN6_14880 [Streptomyces albogriseolus]